MLTKKKKVRKIALTLCVCILLAACLCIPATATTRRHSLAWSTSSTKHKATISGFQGKTMLYAYAVKTESGTSTATTAYVENLNIEKYSVNMAWNFYMDYGFNNGETFTFGRTVSTAVGAEQLSVAVNYSQVYSNNISLFSKYTMDFSQSNAKMTVDSTCPYPQDLPYQDIITFPALSS